MLGSAIEIRVNPDVLAELQRMAEAQEISVSDVARIAIYRDMTKTSTQVVYPDPDWPDLETDLRRAQNWLELRACLLQRGYLVERMGASLVLKSARSNKRFAWPKAKDLTHSALTACFGAPMADRRTNRLRRSLNDQG